MESLGKLGIDVVSLLVYAVNFGLIVFILAKFFTKPLLETMEKRRKTIADNISEAERLKKELVKQKEQMAQDKRDMQAQMDADMKRLHQEIDAKRKTAEQEIEAKKTKMIEEVKMTIESEKSRLTASVKADVLTLVEKMVLDIAHNKIPQEVVEESVEESWKLFNR